MHSVIAQPFDAPQEEMSKRVWWIVRGVLRLVLPVVFLFSILLVSFFSMRDTVVFFDFFPPHLWSWNPSRWLTMGHLLLPLSFFVINMTNRKYGARYALAQVAVTWVLLGLAAFFVMAQFGDWRTDNPFPPLQTSAAFLCAFGVAQFAVVTIFDRTRGRTWWGAPLISLLWASVFYSVIFHIGSNWGLGSPWMSEMVMDLAIKFVIAVLLLIPYQLLRKTIRPLPGYGGA